jgi:hypothetical protein
MFVHLVPVFAVQLERLEELVVLFIGPPPCIRPIFNPPTNNFGTTCTHLFALLVLIQATLIIIDVRINLSLICSESWLESGGVLWKVEMLYSFHHRPNL